MVESPLKENRDLRARKGSDRIQINNLLAAVCVAALALLLASTEGEPIIWSVAQLSLAIPILVLSSLTYSKTVYRDSQKEYETWDKFGWLSHSLGYLLLLNAITIYLYSMGTQFIAWLFIFTVVGLYIIYSVVDIYLEKERLFEKGSKLIFYLAVLFLGSIAPISFNWIN